MITIYTQCRYLKHTGEQCSAEAVDSDPQVVQLCTRHLAMALELIKERRSAYVAERASA